MSTPVLSVVICTHNPHEDFLRRTLGGLSRQTLRASQWEFVLVDNGSSPPVRLETALAGHATARIVAEPELGLTAARLRGIGEARAPLLVFVDDDNILAPDYLERALARANAWPMLGVWGCGSYKPEWEQEPPREFDPYIAYLAVHRAPRDRWSNQPFDYAATPTGAGLCVRSAIARRYVEQVGGDARRKLLGRTGTNLAGCEDFDLAFTAIDLGYGTGVFTDLAMTHLMPRTRVAERYLLQLVEGHAYSSVILHALRDSNLRAPHPNLASHLREFRLRRALDPIALKIHDARRRGEALAWVRLGRPPQ